MPTHLPDSRIQELIERSQDEAQYRRDLAETTTDHVIMSDHYLLVAAAEADTAAALQELLELRQRLNAKPHADASRPPLGYSPPTTSPFTNRDQP